jgi:hypothetical protein
MEHHLVAVVGACHSHDPRLVAPWFHLGVIQVSPHADALSTLIDSSISTPQLCSRENLVWCHAFSILEMILLGEILNGSMGFFVDIFAIFLPWLCGQSCNGFQRRTKMNQLPGALSQSFTNHCWRLLCYPFCVFGEIKMKKKVSWIKQLTQFAQ